MNPSPRAEKYPDLEHIYTQCSGPGALRLAEFVADRIGLRAGARVLDIGIFRGIQTCFLAKEYGCEMVAIDPWVDSFGPGGDGAPYVEHLYRNAREWGVADRVLGVQVGLPETKFAGESFDAAYSTTAIEMIRGIHGEEMVVRCFEEVLRVLRPGGLFGMCDPMHTGGPPPAAIREHVSAGPIPFERCLSTPDAVAAQFRSAGFEVLEAGYAPDARSWWSEFARYDAECRENPEGNPRMLELDREGWVSVGFVIGRKPA